MQRTQNSALHRHIGDIDDLLERADVSRECVELVLAPVELHQRNLKRRLQQAHRRRDAFRLTDPTGVATNILDAVGEPTRRLDRIDRLSILRAALADDALAVDASNITARHLEDPEQLEQIRTEIEAVTNGDSTRIDALGEVADDLTAPVDADAREAIALARAAQDTLSERTDAAVSDAALVRCATRVLRDTDGTAWSDVYPGIERCSLVGLSTIPAPQADFLAALAETTAVDVHVYLRRATGGYLAARHPSLGVIQSAESARGGETSDRLRLANPLESPSVPSVELTARTRREEARVAMSLVSGLCEAGVPARDVAVVAQDLTSYEEPLGRAARQRGVTPTFWTQLYVTRTRPFALFEAVSHVLDADDPDRRTLLRPLEHRWAPPDAAGDRWPLDPATLSVLANALPAGGRPLTTWTDHVQDAAEVDDRLSTYVTSLCDRPDPTPSNVDDLLGTVADTYEAVGLPVTRADDSADLVATEEDARAVVRLRELAEQVGRKFRDRRHVATREQSWGDVAELARLVAQQRPGRREHSNARAVDVFEAADVWALEIPYVVIVGVVAGEWPGTPTSPLPVDLREAILSGDGAASTLVPRTPWTVGRAADHFADALAAATRGLVLTRYTETTDGLDRHPSPFLADLDPTGVSSAETTQLLSADGTLPDSVRDLVVEDDNG